MSRQAYAYAGDVSGELLTWRGQVIVWHNPDEMRFLVPNMRVVRPGPETLAGRPTIQLKDHPDMASVRWPLRRGDFYDSDDRSG